MKIFKYALLAIPFLYFSCSDDDDNTPEPINEEEVITTMTVTLTDAMGNAVTMQTQDLEKIRTPKHKTIMNTYEY